VLSAYQSVAAWAAELQLPDHLAKPFRLEDLLRLIRKHCPSAGCGADDAPPSGSA
jgi:hypothetical protein